MAPPDRRTSAPPSTASPTMAALNDCCVLYLDLAPPELHLHLSASCIAAQSCSMPEAMPSAPPPYRQDFPSGRRRVQPRHTAIHRVFRQSMMVATF